VARPDLGGLEPELLGTPQGKGDDDRPLWRIVLGWLRAALVDNAALKFVALVLSLTVFILVHSDEDAVAGATVEVSYTLPPGKVLLSDPVNELNITVTGSKRRIRRFDPTDLSRITVDLRGRREGVLVFERDMIGGIPDGLELVSITPASMTVKLADRVERLVPVEIETTGRPARGYRVSRLEAVPAQVSVAGSADAVGRIAAVRTVPVSIEGQAGALVEEVPLAPLAGAEVVGEGRVRVEIDLGEEQGVRQLGSLPVVVRPGAGLSPADVARLLVEPATVDVVLRGGQLDLERVAPGTLEAVVKPTAAELAGGGAQGLEVYVVPPRAGIGIEVRPPTVTVRPP
jgi:hypothetical protein